jgi:very-short-patch-repair endonuclease
LKFVRQEPIGPFIVDFVCREKKLIIELDGESHRERGDYDRQRETYLRDHGYTVLRVAK